MAQINVTAQIPMYNAGRPALLTKKVKCQFSQENNWLLETSSLRMLRNAKGENQRGPREATTGKFRRPRGGWDFHVHR